MQLHLIVPFSKYLLQKVFGGLIKVYNKYDDMVVKETGLAFLPTLLFSLISVFPIMIVFSLFGIFYYSIYAWFAVFVVAFANYFRIILREQFKKFKEERQQLFNILKD